MTIDNLVIYFAYAVLGTAVVALFRKKPLVLHGLSLVVYVFLDQLGIRLLSIMMIVWLCSLLLEPRSSRRPVKGVRDVIVLGTLFFLSSFIGIRSSGSLSAQIFFQLIVARFSVCVIWSYLIYATLHSTADIRKFISTYAVLRGIEIVFFGLIQYMIGSPILKRSSFNAAYESIYFEKGTSRLSGLITPDPVYAAYLLIPVMGLFFYLGIIKRRVGYFVAFVLSTVALLLTWARSGWIVIALMLFLMAKYYLKFRIRTKGMIWLLVFVFVLALLFANVIMDRFASDERLQDTGTFAFRLVLYYNFFQNLGGLTLWGLGWTDPGQTGLEMTGFYSSTENLFLQTFSDRGIIGGTIFTALYLVAMWRFFSSWRHLRNGSDLEGDQVGWLLLLIFCAMFALSLTIFVASDEPLHWMFFALAAIVYSNPNSLASRYGKSNSLR